LDLYARILKTRIKHQQMGQGGKKVVKNRSFYLLVTFCFLLQTGCTYRFVADYNSSLSEETIRVAKKVDYFYANLLNTPDSLRTFDRSSQVYTEIEVDINSILMRNKIRPLNEESVKIIENTVSLWQKYKNRHKDENTYKGSLLELHRERLARMFMAMFNAEESKKINQSKQE
jgi:hypothetical protein